MVLPTTQFLVLYCNQLRMSGSAYVFYFTILEFSIRADTFHTNSWQFAVQDCTLHIC